MGGEDSRYERVIARRRDGEPMLAIIDERGPRIVTPEREAELPNEQAARSFDLDAGLTWLMRWGREREREETR